MAQADDVIDPNDLDSIDELLTQAAEEAEPTPAADETMSDDELDDLLESISDGAAQAEAAEPEPEPEIVEEAAPPEVAEPEPAPAEPQAPPEIETPAVDESSSVEEVAAAAVAGAAAATAANSKPQANTLTEEQADEVLQSRLKRKPKTSDDVSVKEMNAVKKLVIIFGAVTTVLILTATGIALWGALAASSAGLTEEQAELLEKIYTETGQSNKFADGNTAAISELEKKIDAVNYQVEQLAADIAAGGMAMVAGMPMNTGAVMQTQAAPLVNLAAENDAHKANDHDTHAAQGTHNTHDTHAAAKPSVQKPVVQRIQQPMMAVASPVMSPDLSVMQKQLDSLSAKLVRAQTRLDEVNKRIKSVQTMQGRFLQQTKKQQDDAAKEQALLEQQREAELEAKRQYERESAYRYNAVPVDKPAYDSYP